MHSGRMLKILLIVSLIDSIYLLQFARCRKTKNVFDEEDHVPYKHSKRDSETGKLNMYILIGCNNESLVSERGTVKFRDTNFDGYAPNLHCRWTITVNPEKIIRMFVDILAIGKDCNPETGSCDSLTILDGITGTQLVTFPQKANVPASQLIYETTSNMATIVFLSNGDSINGYGFEINYFSARIEHKTLCGVPVTQPTIVSNNAGEVLLSVSPYSFPWHVNIFSETKREIHTCSGTIISRDTIITAARCFDPEFNGSDYRVSAGKHSLYEVEKSEVTFNVIGVFLHPKYDKNSLENDIAIVKLRQRIAYSEAIRPACLEGPQDDLPTNTVCMATGWLNKPGADGRFVLTQSIVTFQPMTLCSNMSEPKRSGSICVGFNSPSLNVCNQRAPGGALVCQAGNQWTQYGVVSAGIGCSGPSSPGIFTNIGRYNDWISYKIGSDCGRPAIAPKVFSRIVGGSEAKPNSWPWQVSIRKGNSHHCGGSIIANRWIMTASHCFGAQSHREEYTVATGEHKLRLKDAMERVYFVDKIFRYPEPTEHPLEFDITLLYLAEDIIYSKYVKPVCLADGEFRAGQRCVVTGWGKTQQIAPDADRRLVPMSDVLNELEVPLIEDATCRDAVKRYNQMNLLNISSDLIVCAGYLDGSKDSCFGDSGGPLVCFDDSEGAWKQVGIVSYGRGCAVKDFPGFYSNVSAYYDWIKIHTSWYPLADNTGTHTKQIFDGR